LALALALALTGAGTVVGGCRSVPVGSEERHRGDDAAVEPATATNPTKDSGRRIVAIGDVHGDLEATRAALKLAGLIDASDHWTGGETILVQTGDQLDRGDDELEILELFERIEGEARSAGGEVHVLNGNHELMNASGDFRYVTQGGFADFAGVDATALDRLPEAATVPAQARGRVAAFMPGGPWAKKLAERDVVFVAGGSVFVHGGLTPRWAAEGPEAINRSVRAWLREGGPPPDAVTDSEGPVWTRAYSDGPDAKDCEMLGDVLTTLDAERMVVGHTVHTEGIQSACDDRVWMIDVGMASHYGGRPAALEIVGDAVKVLPSR